VDYSGAFAHLSGLLAAAVEEGLLPANPAAGLTLPKTSKPPVFFWTEEEAARLLLQLGGADALAVELDPYTGLRPGELFGLRRASVSPDASTIYVYGVATRTGWRAWAKSTKSHRPVPVPPHLRDRLRAHLEPLGRDDRVFPAPGGECGMTGTSRGVCSSQR
jgi:integrase